MTVAAEAVSRFGADLDVLVAPGERIGVAVSGGPDSLALLLLAAAARPGLVMAASVDHALRPGSRDEALLAAGCCAQLKVPHEVLTVAWDEPPTTALQERARTARYALLGEWAARVGVGTVATGHHADDQAETLLMRLARGAGLRGLAAMRSLAPLPGDDRVTLVRPLLGWRRADLALIVASAGVTPAVDPSNGDTRHERVRIRTAMAAVESWLDPAVLARSAAHLAEADDAIDHAVDQLLAAAIEASDGIELSVGDAPRAIRRRLVERLVVRLATEGAATPLRGREVDTLLAAIEAGGTATLRGVRASGGPRWHFAPSPRRN